MKKKTNRYRNLLLLLLSIVAFQFLLLKSVDVNREDDFSSENTDVLGTEKFFNDELFVKGENRKLNWVIPENVRGAVIPHHGLAAKYLSSFFWAIEEHEIDTIILIGPNHDRLGEDSVYTSKSAWSTDFGVLEPDTELIDELLASEYFSKNDEIVKDEHSVATIFPYMVNYIPRTKVVPLVVNETEMEEIEVISDIIVEKLEDKVLIIAAVDFSHYLNANEAVEKDTDTLTAIRHKDYYTLLNFGSDHLDSPTSIVLLDMIMQKQGLEELSVLINTNSSELTGNYTNVTGYVVGVY